MADLLSLHWGERIVGVEASVTPGAIRVRTAFSADRTSVAADGELPDESRGLAAVLSGAGVSARKADVVLSQQDVVTRWLELPPVSDDELPEIVRYQAGTKSTLSVDQLIVDYLPLPASEDSETRSVLLATVAKSTVAEIVRDLSVAGIELRSLGVGSLALSDLAKTVSGSQSQGDGLVVVADREQLEVTVHQGGCTVLTHSASLSGETDPVRTAGQAISRALFAAGNSVADLNLNSAVLFGALGEDLVDVVRGRMSGSQGDPRVDVVSLTDTPLVDFQSQPPEPLLGSPALVAAIGGLLAANGQVVERVDFMDPHKPPPPERRVSTQLLVRVAVGVVLAIGLVYGLKTMNERGALEEISSLEKEVQRQRKLFYGKADSAKKLPSTSTVDRWNQKKVQWLDQLNELTPILGDSGEVILTEVNMSQDVRQGLGRITVTGLANDRGPVTKMTSDIRGLENYTVRPSKLDPNKDRQAAFRFRFNKVNILLDGKAKTPGAGKKKTENGQTQTKAGSSGKEEAGS